MSNVLYGILMGVAILGITAASVFFALTMGDGNALVNPPSALPAAYALEDIPLFVTRDPSAMRWARPVADAVAWWNGQVPGLFLDGGELDRAWATGALISIVEAHILPEANGQLHEKDAYLCARRGDFCAITRQYIDLSDLTPDVHALRVRIVAHSIGHAIGLDHDHTLESVMFADSLRGGFLLPDATRALIKRRYGK